MLKIRVRLLPYRVVIVAFGNALEDAAHVRILVRDLLRPAAILRCQCAFLLTPFPNLSRDDPASVIGADDESLVDLAARHPLQGFANRPARPSTIVIVRSVGQMPEASNRFVTPASA